MALILTIVGTIIIQNRHLQREKNYSLSISETSGALIVIFDYRGKISYFNKTCEELTGYPRNDVLKHRITDLRFIINPELFSKTILTSFSVILPILNPNLSAKKLLNALNNNK